MTTTNIDLILKHAVANNLNVLLKGKHGVGKTAMVQQCFDEAGLKWLYFSAATMDPWVDFIGVPKEKTDKDGNTYLDLVRPKELALDEVDAIFFDELNRAHKKTRNAVMELIQFKRINGKKFNRLKIVWGAINPHDEEGTYDVEKLDPAQEDRFEIHVDVPSEPDMTFFKNTYGSQGERAVKWWLALDEKAKALVSPRRLEYALRVLNSNGDPRYVLDARSNVSHFISTMSKGDPLEVCNKLIQQNPSDIQRYLMDNNNLRHVQNIIFNEERFLRGLARYVPSEVLLKELTVRQNANNNKLVAYVSNNAETFDHLTENVLSNPTTYSDALTKGFEAHKKRKERAQRSALSTSKEMLDKLSNVTKAAAIQNFDDQIVTINGTKVRAGDLTPDNYESLTGRRFRVTKPQQDMISANKMTREQALRDYLNKLLRSGDNDVDNDIPF